MIGHWIAWDTENLILKNAPWSHGVILFFVLSGYLISNILFEQRESIELKKTGFKEAIKTFYIRRFLRIFPIYYLLIFYLFYINHNNTREIFPWLLTYSTNILQGITGEYVGDFNHFWSLAVEEQFYLFWPFLILLVSNNRIFRIIIFLIMFSFISRIACVYIGKQNWMLGAYFTPNLFLPLALGSLIAYFKRYKEALFNTLHNSFVVYGSAVIYLLLYYFLHYKLHIHIFDAIFDEYLFAVVCFFIVLKASNNGFTFISKFILEHEVVVFTGKISYGLYVYHLFIIGFFWNYLSPKYGIGVANKHAIWLCYFIVAYLAAILSFYLIERPINNLKKLFSYS